MTLSDLASIGSLVSGVAVLVSLVFLYFQLRQMNSQAEHAERVQFATIRHTRAARVVDISLASAEPAWADAVSKGQAGDDDLSRTQLWQFSSYMIARLSNAEDSYYQFQEGSFDKAAFDRFARRMKVMFVSVGARAQYTMLRHNFGSEFVAFMDEILAEVPAALPPADPLAPWKAAIAAEKASAR